MDIRFQKKYSYTIPLSFDETKTKLEGILNNKWYDLSANYYGTVSEEGAFSFKQKVILFSSNFGRPVYLDGHLVKNDKDTTIHIRLSPNLAFVFVIYLLPLISLNVLFGDNSLMGQQNGKLNNFLTLLVMEFIMFTIIQATAFFLRRKFEKVMIENK
jgi:hypothetical protein